RANILVNVVDDPPLCSFFYPAVYQEGSLKIAVSTNGRAPLLAKLIRDDIKSRIGGTYGNLIDRVAQVRESLFQSTSDSATRRRLLEGLVASMMEGALPSGDPVMAVPNQSAPAQRRGAGPSTPLTAGQVTLVGGGPGDPDLITVKGLRAIQQADVIVYDALVNPQLLAHARMGVEVVFVGKRSGQHSAAQEVINHLLVSRAQAGLRVVRLKGGDPFIYGRGGEEAEHLTRAGIELEVIPGITAGTAAPACAGIPLTSRGTSSSVAFVSGHLCRDADDDAVDWSRLAQAVDTLVIYMGVNNRARIARQLIQGGRPPETPVAIIQKGTYPDQRTAIVTLAELLNEGDGTRFDTPAIIVIGEVVALRSAVQGRERQPGDAGVPLGLAGGAPDSPRPVTSRAEFQEPLDDLLERFENQRIPADSDSLTVHSN
ncbi:MAG: uroporphyrinogen-III C-methyltransferase, partial [Candidatus Marinimicrobia bacterium]|nr:uroporphyrinogen-III C-methyltransferase [Candidatus Neomarinimicrobiota bacterium]